MNPQQPSQPRQLTPNPDVPTHPTPDQILGFQRNQEAALLKVLDLKKRCLQLIDDAEGFIASGDLANAFGQFLEIQKIEYSLVIEGLSEKLSQTQQIIKQLQTPASGIVLPRFTLPR